MTNSTLYAVILNGRIVSRFRTLEAASRVAIAARRRGDGMAYVETVDA
jgi:hypothetical protein